MRDRARHGRARFGQGARADAGCGFRLRRLLSLPTHGPFGEDRWAATASTWALCDGASEGYDGAGWAAILARALVLARCPELSVERARRAYAFQSESVLRDDWLGAAGRARGSWSTALCVRLSPGGSFGRVWARGDSVLFLRDGLRTVATFPELTALDFSRPPELVAARGTDAEPLRRAAFSLVGLRAPSLALATDGLAAYALGLDEVARCEFWRFLARADHATLRSWARAEVEARRLRDDDLTLLELAP